MMWCDSPIAGVFSGEIHAYRTSQVSRSSEVRMMYIIRYKQIKTIVIKKYYLLYRWIRKNNVRKYENTHPYKQAMISVYIHASMYSASVRRPI